MAGITFRLWGAVRTGLIVIWTIFWISAALVVALLTLDRRKPLSMARRFWAPGVLWLGGVGVDLCPMPALDWSRPHVFVMNHQSMLDIPIAFAKLPVDLRFIAKHSLARVPFLGWYMTLTGMIFVNRSKPSLAYESLARAAKRIHDGVSVLIYPEGTRPSDGQLLPFKRGGFGLAIDAGVPIVPIAVDPSWKRLPSGATVIRPGRVRLKIGEPIPTEHRKPAERDALALEVHRTVETMLRELRFAEGDPSSSSRDLRN